MKKILFPVFTVVFMYSCSNSDDHIVDPNEKYLDGFFVSNEGTFTKGNGSVSHINGNLNSISNDIFKTSNNRSIGDVTQSMVVTDKYVFVVMNNSNTIEVVNKKTFQSVYTISDQLSFPRYAVVKNGKLYVSLMNDAFIQVYNAETFQFIKSVELNDPAEQLVATNEYVYAANNFYSGGNRVEVIDFNSDSNTIDVTFNAAINGLTTNGQYVYVMTNNDTNSYLSMINGTDIESTVNLEMPNGRNLVSDGNVLYFTSGTDVYKINNSLKSAVAKLFNVGNGDAYSLLYGFNVFNGYIFTGNAGNFTDNSEIKVYNENGSVVKQFTAGIGTNGFYKY